MSNLTHGSLCSGGVDGMAEGARRAGIETIWNCENEEYRRKLLKQEYPNAKQYNCIITDQPTERAAIISITFECQGISIANTSAPGIYGNGYALWASGLRIFDKLRPSYIVFENSAELINRGFEIILHGLSEIGYNAEWQCLPLTSFGVQQDRERLYLIAYPSEIMPQGSSQKTVFSERVLQRQFARVSPGWRTRRDIPEPRCIGTLNGSEGGANRLKILGDMVHPLAAQYLFECIKQYQNATA